METFKIEVQESLARVIEVEGSSLQDAISKVSKQYKETEIVLDYNDFVEVNFIDINSQNINDERNILIKKVIDYLYKDEERHYEECEDEPQNHIYRTLKRLKEINDNGL